MVLAGPALSHGSGGSFLAASPFVGGETPRAPQRLRRAGASGLVGRFGRVGGGGA